MAGVKGAKQAAKLTDEQIALLKVLQAEDNVSILTQYHVDRLGLSRLTIMRRAHAAGIPLRFGVKFCDFDENTPGRDIVSLRCTQCGEEYLREAYRLHKRKFQIELCGKHYVPYITRTDEWRETNRQAQLIAQNRPDVKAKQREAQRKRFAAGGEELRDRYRKIGKKLWEDDDYRVRQTVAAYKNWDNPDYRDRVISKSKAQYHGVYNGIKYSSLVELSFILWQKSLSNHIKRFDDVGIEYYDVTGRRRKYYPDFVMTMTIVEVKGSGRWYQLHKENVRLKHEALKKYCKANNLQCRIVFDRDIPNLKTWRKKAKEIHAQNS